MSDESGYRTPPSHPLHASMVTRTTLSTYDSRAPVLTDVASTTIVCAGTGKIFTGSVGARPFTVTFTSAMARSRRLPLPIYSFLGAAGGREGTRAIREKIGRGRTPQPHPAQPHAPPPP